MFIITLTRLSELQSSSANACFKKKKKNKSHIYVQGAILIHVSANDLSLLLYYYCIMYLNHHFTSTHASVFLSHIK